MLKVHSIAIDRMMKMCSVQVHPVFILIQFFKILCCDLYGFHAIRKDKSVNNVSLSVLAM